MSNINISQTKNKVTVNGETRVVTVKTAGPQGIQGEGFDITLNHAGKVNNSIMYYQQSSDTLRLDATRTVENLVDGGNF
tara:strand:+ start:667 stop:903 length:237 start_codon:yes stop_codon:yes gene_type:complete